MTENAAAFDLRRVIVALRKNLQWIVGCVIVGFVALFLISRFFLPAKYTSSISMYVNNNNDASAGTPININDINASQKLVNTYIVILQHDEVLNQVADRLMEEYTEEDLDKNIGLTEVSGKKVLKAETLRKALTLSAVNGTEVLQIRAQTKNAMLSARICNLIAEVGPGVLERVIRAGSVEIIGQAEPVFEKTSPHTLRNSVIGALLGLIVSVGGVLLRFALDNTIKGEEDIKERLKIPVLGEIPDFSAHGKGGYGYGR